MNAHTTLPRKRGPKPSPYAGKVAIRHLIEAAKAAGLDVGGFDARPDGTVRIFARGEQARGSLFDELERQNKL